MPSHNRSAWLMSLLILAIFTSCTEDPKSEDSARPKRNVIHKTQYNHTTVVFNNHIWVVGGNEPDEEVANVWRSEDGKYWEVMSSHPTSFARESHASVVFNNKIWVFGGASWSEVYPDLDSDEIEKLMEGEGLELEMEGKYYADVWASSDGMKWDKITNRAPWGPRDDHSVVVFNNKIWLLGGNKPVKGDIAKVGLNDVWCTLDGKNWEKILDKAPWERRSGHVSVVHNGKIWVMGGSSEYIIYDSGSYALLYTGDIWNSEDGKTWIQVLDYYPWPSRGGSTLLSFDDKLWVMGGDYNKVPMVDPKNRNDYSNNIWSSTDGIIWQQMPSPPWSPRENHTSVVFNDRMWIIGGSTDDQKRDVWSSKNGNDWELECDDIPLR